MTSGEKRSGRQPPRLPPAVMERGALLDRLTDATRRRLTWVTAPAGFGKTVLATQWALRRATGPVLWIDVGGRDDPDVLVELDEALANPVEDATGVPATLIVDGCESALLAARLVELARAARARTSGVPHVLVLGRAAPPKPMARLVLDGDGVVIRADEMDLSAGEVARVIDELNPGRLDPGVADRIASLFGGWVAGVRLLGLSRHRSGGDAADALLAAAADDLEAYVLAEILDVLTDEDRSFLLLTSGVQDAPMALCNAMTGRRDASAVVERLRDAGVPIDRSNIDTPLLRLLPPVRAALQRIAARRSPDQRAEAHRAAAAWYSEHGHPIEAAWLLVDLEAWDDAINVVLVNLMPILEHDQAGRLADLAMALPIDVLRQRVGLALGGAWALRLEGRIGAANELLNVFAAFMDPVEAGIAGCIRSGMVSFTLDPSTALDNADAMIAAVDAAADLEDAWAAQRARNAYTAAGPETWRVLASSYALIACAYGGHWDRAERYLFDAPADVMVTLPHLQVVQRHGARATYHALGGAARAALLEASAGLHAARTAGLDDHRVVADAYASNGEALRLQLRFEEARTALTTARELAASNERLNLLAAIAASSAHLAFDAGDRAAALADLEAVRARAFEPPSTIAAMLAAVDARLRFDSGDNGGALEVLRSAPRTPMTAGTLVTMLCALGQLTAARTVLDDWPHRDTPDGAVRAELATAIVHETNGAVGPADSALARALELAGPHDLRQPLLEVGAVLSPLLQRVRRGATSAAALELATALRASPLFPASTRSAALSQREQTILAHLADGLSNQDIARLMHVSPNTVKTHIQSLYRKLAVSSRHDAVRVHQAARRRPPT